MGPPEITSPSQQFHPASIGLDRQGLGLQQLQTILAGARPQSLIAGLGSATMAPMPDATPSSPTASSTATAWGFLAPALVLLAVSVLIPGAMALLISFTRSGLDVSEPLHFIGLANFQRLLADPMLVKVMEWL